MSLHHFARVLRHGWYFLVGGFLLGTVLALGAALLAQPTYTSVASVMVSLPKASSIAELQQGDVFTQSRARSYAALGQSERVLGAVAKGAGLKGAADVPVAVSVEPQTSVIDVVATAGDPQKAADYANAAVRELTKAVPEVDGGQNSAVGIATLSSATPATSPTSPSKSLYVAIGALVGLTLGFLVAALRLGRSEEAPLRSGRRGRDETV